MARVRSLRTLRAPLILSMLAEIAVADNQVCRSKPKSRTKLSGAISAGWSRCALKIGHGKFADDADMDAVTVRRGIAGPSLPSAENLLNSLAADPTALNEALALYGLIAAPKQANPANDMQLAAGLGHSVAELIDRLRDGKRCHIDTAVLAALFRELIPQMQAIVDEDDARRFAA
jgi:hypothetical protein